MENTNTPYNQMFSTPSNPPTAPVEEPVEAVEVTVNAEVAPEVVEETVPVTPEVTEPTPVRPSAARVGTVTLENEDGMLNIRKQPSRTANILATVPNGAQLKISNWESNGWYRVSTADRKVGYCMKQFVTINR